jgi:predicted permease
MQTLWQDLRYGARMLLKTPGFSLIAVITLALGMGANTAIFSLLDQVMLRRLPVERPDELVVLRSPGPIRGHLSTDGDNAAPFSFPMYKNLREKNTAFAGLLARYAIPLSVSAQGQTERAAGELVSGNYFEVLGVRPALGRVFSLEDDQLPGAHPLAVLSHGYWTKRFAQNPSALNQTILVNGHSLTVVGVARAGFSGVQVGQSPDIFIPLAMKAQMRPNAGGMDRWDSYWLAVMGRLKAGERRAQAEAAVAPLYRALLEETLANMKSTVDQGWRDRFLAKRIESQPGAQGRPTLQNDAGAPLRVLLGMVFLVLLIACTNVANLLFVRGLGRQRELAIRLALGASRWQLMRQLLIESLLLSLAGGALGLLVASWISDALIRAIDDGQLARGLSAGLDGRVLLFTFALSMATGLVFGLIPAWRATSGDLTPALKDQSSASSASHSQTRLRKSLVAAQVALTMLLLVGAGLLTRTLWNLRGVDLGLKPEQLITFSVAPELSGYSPEKTIAFTDRLLESLAASPGVDGVAVAEVPILTNNDVGSNVTPEGSTEDTDVQRNWLGPGSFAALGVPLIAGREFARTDASKSQKVVILNQTAAARLFPNRNPIGLRIAFGAGNVKPDIEVVGVVKDSKHSNVRGEFRPFVYQPYTQQDTLGSLSFYARTRQTAEAIIPLLRREARRLDANLPVYDVKSVETVIAENLFGERIVAFLSLCFGALAALLAGVGLYGVLAHWVVQRTHEIGIRIALGAAPGDIRSLVLKQGVTLTLAGVAIGVAGGLGVARLLGTLLYGVGPADPMSFVVAGLLLAAISLLACYLPARRATKTDPIVALRCE